MFNGLLLLLTADVNVRSRDSRDHVNIEAVERDLNLVKKFLELKKLRIKKKKNCKVRFLEGKFL